MIDLLTIFGKGGIVLWCFQEGSQLFASTINELIKEVLLQKALQSSPVTMPAPLLIRSSRCGSYSGLSRPTYSYHFENLLMRELMVVRFTPMTLAIIGAFWPEREASIIR
uniref:Uncharacterized protein n=1 Tax=Plectus sambesii TaxID=2011161 RepID=A0A914WL73_9BILA